MEEVSDSTLCVQARIWIQTKLLWTQPILLATVLLFLIHFQLYP